MQQEQRRLAAILAADVVGYSKLMASDEPGTLALLRKLRAEVIEPKVAQFHGRIVGSAGDSLLIEFASAVNAVRCAVEAQKELADRNASLPEDRRMTFRMGVNLGDVIAEGHTIYGDGVNIASRLEKLAKPGGICIGRNVYDQVKSKLVYSYTDLGPQRVHNLPDPVHAYQVQLGATIAARQSLPLPDKPSIAILPFENLSADREQEYFADGIVEEIITALSRFRQLFVIARNSSFTYKGRAVDVKQVGRELGVRYVLEGSVRKAGSRVRITGQLVDTSTSAHLWADRFEGGLDDIFGLQDQLTANVVGAIAPRLEQAEIERAKHKSTENLDAYDYFLRGMAGLHQLTREGNAEALAHFRRAIQFDPNFAAAYAMAARCFAQRRAGTWMDDRQKDVEEASTLARRAVELGHDDAFVLAAAGFVLADVVDNFTDGDALIDQALELNPNLAWAWLFSGWVKISLGQPDAGIERINHAIRLSPHDPHAFSMQCAIGSAHFIAGRYREALAWSEKAVRGKPDFVLHNCLAAASAALGGYPADAQKALARLRRVNPALRISNLQDVISYLRKEDFAKWVEGLRLAGLPE